ncbi:MAG: polyprenyl synthetase family protein [Candidatus Marinimicrobia bacterium]|nr:polyprenyl synthetase family protein [Candidatus Neomarinimicrobiota bacterium]MDP6610750.1 polyprenyl synthetase family protein [Candidatus Neomarinimicrobiota bacterium]
MKKDLKSLKHITDPIFEDIKLFEQEFRNALRSEVRLINLIGKYIIRHKGKHIRPVLTILSSRVCGQPTINSYRAAAMIELLHIATLIHDDVVDEAEKRRGFPSINRVWKNKIAVLMGDFILSKTLINMVGLKDFAALQLIADTAEKLAAGEILQIEKSLTKSMTEDVYYDMIYQKTASLISTSCELGAITSTGEEKDRKAMVTYGTKLGMAFQVKDDLFDLLGSEKQTGKDLGADVKRNMVTLPLIHSYKKLSRTETRLVKKILSLKKKSSNDLNDLREIVDGAGGFNYAEQKIEEFNHQALDAISPYLDSPYKQSMVDLISFNAQRTG